MLPLVRVGAAVSADVVTSTKLFVMRYNMTSLASGFAWCPGVVGFLYHIVDMLIPRQSSVYGYSKVLGAFNFR